MPYSTDFGVYTSFCWHRNRATGATLNYFRIAQISQSVRLSFGTVFKEVQSAVHRSYRTDFYSLYSHFAAQKARRFVVSVFKKFGTVFKEVVQPLNTQKFVVAVGMNFEASVQPVRGTNIEEQSCTLVQKILERILSLTQNLCEDLAWLSR
jgi:hypothetical protein